MLADLLGVAADSSIAAHWRSMAMLWLALMAAVAGVTVAVITLAPRWRGRVPVLVPVVVGVGGTVIAVVTVAQSPALSWSDVLLPAGPLAAGWSWGLAGLAGLVVGVVGAWASFQLEKTLLAWRPQRQRSTAGLPAGVGLELPSRNESMAGVARVARTPALFLAVSLLSATGEELFFRAAMLAPQWQTGSLAPWWGVLAQAGLFAALHLAFGWRSVAAKFVLGLALAVGALTGGLLAGALLPHLLFQVRVLAQFTKPGQPTRKESAHV